jgi:hypothetical protein
MQEHLTLFLMLIHLDYDRGRRLARDDAWFPQYERTGANLSDPQAFLAETEMNRDPS